MVTPFSDELRKYRPAFERVKILDATLREGEQTPGVSFTIDQKLEIAKKLDEIGVHMIEAATRRWRRTCTRP